MGQKKSYLDNHGFDWSPKGENQKLFSSYIKAKKVVFGLGLAGTGKSCVAMYSSLDLLDKKVISKVVITRPLVSVGKDLGYFPGGVLEKCEPYMRPLNAILAESNHPDTQKLLSHHSPVEVIPISLMRGMTFNDTVLIIDEAQNLVWDDFKVIMTRLGFNSKLIFTGDSSQIDIKKKDSALEKIAQNFAHLDEVGVVRFGLEDIQRDDFVGKAIQIFFKMEQE